MMYLSSIRDEQYCDFPGCANNFEQASGAKVAIRKRGSNLAFCTKHAEHLKNEGVILKSLSEIHAEKKDEKTIPPPRELTEAERIIAFIESLK